MTQVLPDVPHIWRPPVGGGLAPVGARLKRQGLFFASFCGGGAAAALISLAVGVWCFLVPPLVALAEIRTLSAKPAQSGARLRGEARTRPADRDPHRRRAWICGLRIAGSGNGWQGRSGMKQGPRGCGPRAH